MKKCKHINNSTKFYEKHCCWVYLWYCGDEKMLRIQRQACWK